MLSNTKKVNFGMHNSSTSKASSITKSPSKKTQTSRISKVVKSYAIDSDGNVDASSLNGMLLDCKLIISGNGEKSMDTKNVGWSNS